MKDIEQEITEVVHVLPAEKQAQVLEFAENLKKETENGTQPEENAETVILAEDDAQECLWRESAAAKRVTFPKELMKFWQKASTNAKAGICHEKTFNLRYGIFICRGGRARRSSRRLSGSL